MTVVGTGFGSDAGALSIEVGGVPCDVLKLEASGVRCRLHSTPAAAAPTRSTPTDALGNDLGSFAGERGVRWQWSGANTTRERSMLLPSFALPSDCASGCQPGWRELGPQDTVQLIEVRSHHLFHGRRRVPAITKCARSSVRHLDMHSQLPVACQLLIVECVALRCHPMHSPCSARVTLARNAGLVRGADQR